MTYARTNVPDVKNGNVRYKREILLTQFSDVYIHVEAKCSAKPPYYVSAKITQPMLIWQHTMPIPFSSFFFYPFISKITFGQLHKS